jgi:hypothetical protein
MSGDGPWYMNAWAAINCPAGAGYVYAYVESRLYNSGNQYDVDSDQSYSNPPRAIASTHYKCSKRGTTGRRWNNRVFVSDQLANGSVASDSYNGTIVRRCQP